MKFCADTKSKGEVKIQEFLDQFNMIKYSMQFGYPDCKYKIQLKYDFLISYNDKLNIIVEYDGIQHFEPVDFAGKGKEWAIQNFRDTQIKDSIKNQYCLERNIPIVRIPYWDFENISTILENVFKYFHIIELEYDEVSIAKYLIYEPLIQKVV